MHFHLQPLYGPFHLPAASQLFQETEPPVKQKYRKHLKHPSNVMKYDGYLITGLPPIHGLSIEMIKLDAKPLVGHLQRLN